MSDAAVHDRLRGRAPARRRQGPRRRRASGARAPRGHARPAARARWPPGGETRARRGSCTASTATPPGCWSSRAPRRPTGCCRRRSRERLIEREYLALVEGRPPARTGTIDAPIGRDPRVRTRMAVGGAARRARRAPTSRSSAPSRHLAAAPAPGDRAHPPDPRAPAGHRPSRVRRPRVRHRRAARARAPVPARHPPGLRASAHAASASRSISPLPADLAALALAETLSGRREAPRRDARVPRAPRSAILEFQSEPRPVRQADRGPARERRQVARSGSAPSARNLKRVHTRE